VNLKELRKKAITNNKNPHPLFTADEGDFFAIMYLIILDYF